MQPLAVSTCIALLLAAPPVSTGQVRISSPDPPCERGFIGFQGEFELEGEVIRFRSCARGNVECHSAITSGDGQPIVSLEHSESTYAFRIAGEDINATHALDETQRQRIAETLGSPGSRIGERLWTALQDLGLGPVDGPWMCLWRLSQSFERRSARSAE